MASENRPKWRLSTSNLWRPYKPVYQSSVGFWLAERIIEAQNRHKHDNFNGISPKLWKSSQLYLPNSVGFLTRSKSHKNSEIPIPQTQRGRHFSRQNTRFKMTNPPALEKQPRKSAGFWIWVHILPSKEPITWTKCTSMTASHTRLPNSVGFLTCRTDVRKSQGPTTNRRKAIAQKSVGF